MARIGLIDIDNTSFPNIALGKIARFHAQQGDEVEWVDPMFGGGYDKVYMSKVFNFSPDYDYPLIADEIEKGGTGYDLHKALPDQIDRLQPDYSIYPEVNDKTAYGFLTRGCPNKCKWCVVPKKEGSLKPYMDVEEIAIEGRKNLVLMDNNILASDYGLEQIEKIIKKGYRVDFNQAMDARLVTDEIAQMLAKVRWLNQIRFGCDTHAQIEHCRRAMELVNKYKKKPAYYLLYTMIGDDIEESYERLSMYRESKNIRVVAQPFRDYNNPQQIIPQWQKDMARWAMRREFYTSCDFKDYEVRKDFKCKEYF